MPGSYPRTENDAYDKEKEEAIKESRNQLEQIRSSVPAAVAERVAVEAGPNSVVRVNESSDKTEVYVDGKLVYRDNKDVTDSGADKRLAAYKKHSGNWASGSLNGTLDKYAQGVKGQLSLDGVKTNFINEKAEIKIMKDNENNYFRIYDMNRKTYLDASGSVVKTGSLKGKDARNFLQEQTHIKNIDQ